MTFLFCLTVCLMGLYPQPLFCAGDPKPATVLVQQLNLRAGPGRHHPVIATLNRGARLLVLSYEGDWVRVFFEEKTGFVMNLENFILIKETGLEDPASVQEVKKFSKDTIHRHLASSMKKIAFFSKEEAAVIDQLDHIEMNLNRSRQDVAALSSDLTAIERQINKLEGDFKHLEHRIETNRGYVADRLTSLYKLSWLGQFHVLASSDSMVDFFNDKRNLEQVLLYDEMVRDRLAGDLSRLNSLMEALVKKKKKKQITFADLSERIDVMKAEQSEKEALLADIRAKKSLQMAAAESLKRSARDLDETVIAFSVESEKKVPIGVKEKPFASLKGLLMMPVKGTVTSFFWALSGQQIQCDPLSKRNSHSGGKRRAHSCRLQRPDVVRFVVQRFW
jgi:peptidoglycan hydrolase CwlO-like protein